MAGNLVQGDTNGLQDVFVVDRWNSTIERVSVGTGDVESPGASAGPGISADGRYVVFWSQSSTWDPRDTDPGWDVYLRDRVAKTTELISLHVAPPVGSPNAPGQGPRITPDGRFVVFHHAEDIFVPGDTNQWSDVFLFDRSNGKMEMISVDSSGAQADWDSGNPATSGDGRFVAFISGATNWYPGNPPPGFSSPQYFVYVRDRTTQTTKPVLLDSAGVLGPGVQGTEIALSFDGRYLLCTRGWPNQPVRPIKKNFLFVQDLLTGGTQPVGFSVFGNQGTYSEFSKRGLGLSADGRFVVFASEGDEHVLHTGNKGWNVYLSDRLAGITHAVGLGPSDEWPSIPGLGSALAFRGSISADGTAVVFISDSPSFGSGNTLLNVYVRSCDWSEPSVYCESQLNSQHCRPSISSSGSPSASAGSGFTIEASKLLGAGAGFFFYSTARPILTPFQGGYLCMEAPIRRFPSQATGGSPPPGCTGTLSIDLNAWIASGADPSLVAGENVCIQAWSRDGGSPTGGNLTDAVALLIDP